ncbi:MAG: glycosyl hydrolase 115 family protein [Candidatus Dadabacteria bacterium]
MAFQVYNSPGQHGGVVIVDGKRIASVVVDPGDYEAVKLAAKFFSDDVKRVTGQQLPLIESPTVNSHLVIAGTLGHSALIDKLVKAGKIKDLKKIKGQWEGTLVQVVEKPFAGVERAFVIIGNDRRGTAYGLMKLSEKIGVSPWYWWADVPVRKKKTLILNATKPEWDAPAVKYRGIFINDEDWGIHEWAKKNFETSYGGIGPHTYEKVFELMMRLRLNYIWPAMHECSKEFASEPENYELADRYGIVAGSSHCEPMLCNNVHWDEKTRGKWNYSLNKDTIYNYWKESVQTRGAKEAVYTLGIRGIHDRGMEMPPNDLPSKIKLVSEVFADQRQLLNSDVSKQWGPIAQVFVPYKEVLPIYDAGLQVPPDVTLMWVDDNFGYIRRLGAPGERNRPGGAGVYWHLSYYGNPHSYTWINSTAPALMWEELHKAWENDARTMWVINVGDIKPMEVGIDYFSKLAWKPTINESLEQPAFLKSFISEHFGEAHAQQISEFMGRFYRLGTIRKPELMNREWALSLSSDYAAQLKRDYEKLLQDEKRIHQTIPAEMQDAYTELVGFPARVLAATGLVFMADRDVQLGNHASTNKIEMDRLYQYLNTQVDFYNNDVAKGKWKYMMPGTVTGKYLPRWNSQVAWPWGETVTTTSKSEQPNRIWRDAYSFDKQLATGVARWKAVSGLGASAHALVLTSATLESSWKQEDKSAPTLEYEFQTMTNGGDLLIDFLPTFRIYTGMQLRVVVNVDDQPSTIVEVPGSNGKEDENGPNRNQGIRNNYVRAQVPFKNLLAGAHKLSIKAMDPGVVIDRVSLPQ